MHAFSQTTRMPPVARRFGEPGGNPQGNGRPSTAWIRKRLNQPCKTDAERTQREAIFDHLVEIATSWEIRISGRGADGEPIEVASGRDAVEAAKLLLAYDLGKPPESRDLESMSIRERWSALAEVAQKMAALPPGKQPSLSAAELTPSEDSNP